jgi:hypothetical protein
VLVFGLAFRWCRLGLGSAGTAMKADFDDGRVVDDGLVVDVGDMDAAEVVHDGVVAECPALPITALVADTPIAEAVATPP